jgi:dUTP pyrophosphatase
VPSGRPTDLLPYVRADSLAYAPTKAYEDDAGLDLAACEDVTIPAGGSALVRTGLKFALPPGYWGLILGRSSTWANRKLVCMPGVIDSGWRGELFVSLWNPGTEEAKILVGERVGQYILLPAWAGHLTEVEQLPTHARGENGFGSSGL